MEKHNREANLELIALATTEATMTKDEEFAFYMDRGLRNKASLLEEIKDCKERFKNPPKEKKSDAYYERLMMLIDRFYEDVSSMLVGVWVSNQRNRNNPFIGTFCNNV